MAIDNNDLEVIIQQMSDVANILREERANERNVILTSISFVRIIEENAMLLSESSYERLKNYHDEIMKSYGVTYDALSFKLLCDHYE